MFDRRFNSYETFQISLALKTMIKAHEGQQYGDMDYFQHPIMVAQEIWLPDAVEVVAALLHDTVEDTPVTLIEIEVNFGASVAEIVRLLSKDKTLDYRQNIQRIIDSKNVSAMRVKLADNTINLNGDKSQMSEDRRTRLIDQYEMSIKMLNAALQTAAVQRNIKR